VGTSWWWWLCWRKARGGDAHGGTHGGSGGGDLVVEARAGGRWHRLRVREAVKDRCTTLGSGGWTRRSLERAGDGELPSTEEADGGGIGSL
jgi:hypothetical protein